MTDFRAMYDREYIGAFDLPPGGKEVPVEIARVEARDLMTHKGETKRCPVVFFKDRTLGMVLNKVNGRTIAKSYGPDTTKWTGKTILLYATTTKFGSETVECIRVKVPK